MQFEYPNFAAVKSSAQYRLRRYTDEWEIYKIKTYQNEDYIYLFVMKAQKPNTYPA